MKAICYNLFLVLILSLGLMACGSDSSEESQAEKGEMLRADNADNQATPVSNESAESQADETTDSPQEAEAQEGTPEMTFEEIVYDFGEVEEGTLVKHAFSFRNTGNAPLTIEDAKASCGCTVPSWPEKPIPPGQKAEIEVEFNSKNRVGVANKTVTITANTNPPITKLQIKGTVKSSAVSNMQGPRK